MVKLQIFDWSFIEIQSVANNLVTIQNPNFCDSSLIQNDI